jgi:hypothetical protein
MRVVRVVQRVADGDPSTYTVQAGEYTLELLWFDYEVSVWLEGKYQGLTPAEIFAQLAAQGNNWPNKTGGLDLGDFSVTLPADALPADEHWAPARVVNLVRAQLIQAAEAALKARATTQPTPDS